MTPAEWSVLQSVALASLLAAMKELIETDDRLLALTTISFDMALVELLLPLVVGAQQSIGQRMKICLASVQHRAAYHTGMEVRQQADQAHDPEIKICQGHPDGIGFQMMDHGQRQPEDIVIGFAVGQ